MDFNITFLHNISEMSDLIQASLFNLNDFTKPFVYEIYNWIPFIQSKIDFSLIE